MVSRSWRHCAPAPACARCTWGAWRWGALFIVFGALVNAIYLFVEPEYYATFADASPFPFVTDTWNTLVLPHQNFFITVLIIFEATMGVLILSGGPTNPDRAVGGLIGFHIGRLAFGGVLWPWAAVMLTALVLLLRAERKAAPGLAAQRLRDPAHVHAWRGCCMWRTYSGVLLVAHGLLTIVIWAPSPTAQVPMNTSKSWLLGDARTLSVLLAVSAGALIALAGAGLLTDQNWWSVVGLAGATLSLALFGLFFTPW